MTVLDLHETMKRHAQSARHASRRLAVVPTDVKNKALSSMADALEAAQEDIQFRNGIDVEAAGQAGLSKALVDRLTLTPARIKDMANGVRDIAALPDPAGEIISEWTIPNGARVQKVRVPLGVIGVIYESRPNVTVDAAALCLKSGNAVILRGGKEAMDTNSALAAILSQEAVKGGLPEGVIQFVDTSDRQAIQEMVTLDTWVDLIIPRGGEEMVHSIRQMATVPVLSHGQGLCSVYVDEFADLARAEAIVVNAKTQRPGVCNAAETLLVHKNVAKGFLPQLAESFKKKGVEIRGDENVCSLISWAKPATKEDWRTEFLDLIMAIRIVDSLEEAIAHINTFGSHHSDAIVTENPEAAERFLQEVDSAAVFHNASTRLHDGSVFGLGAEMGISTAKLHARGTMGLRELTTTKYLVRGTGQIRE